MHHRTPMLRGFQVVVALAQTLQIPRRRHPQPITTTIPGTVTGIITVTLGGVGGVVVDDMIDLTSMRRHITPREPTLPITATYPRLLCLGGHIPTGDRVRRQPNSRRPGQPRLGQILRQPAGTIEPDLHIDLIGSAGAGAVGGGAGGGGVGGTGGGVGASAGGGGAGSAGGGGGGGVDVDIHRHRHTLTLTTTQRHERIRQRPLDAIIALVAAVGLRIPDRPHRGVELGEAVFAQHHNQLPEITSALIVDPVRLTDDRLRLVIRWGGDGLNGLDDAAKFPGEHPGAGQGLEVLPRAQVGDEPVFHRGEIVVGYRGNGCGDGGQALMRPCPRPAHTQHFGHAAQHHPDVAVSGGFAA